MAFKQLTLDAFKGPTKFQAPKNAEAAFYRALKMVAKATAGIVNAHINGSTIEKQNAMTESLKRYSEALGPWAERQARKMLDQVAIKSKKAFNAQSGANRLAYQNAFSKNNQKIAQSLKESLADTHVGRVAQTLLNEQVALIKSLPIEAGLRAQKLALENFYSGSRAKADQGTINELRKTMGPDATESNLINRAKLIAITETARANAAISQARATAVGLTHYKWRNSGDGAVRDAHRMRKGKPLDGQVFAWNDPPTLDDGTKGNPGTFPRCRCFAEAIFDD